MLRNAKKKKAKAAEAVAAADESNDGQAVQDNQTHEGFAVGIKYMRPVLINRKNFFEGSCEWLDKATKKWYSSSRKADSDEPWKRILHIEGKQGSGKTVFLSHLVDQGHPRGTAVRDNKLEKNYVRIGGCYFFSRLYRRINNVKIFIRAISDQLRLSVDGFEKALKSQKFMDEFFLRKMAVDVLFDKLVSRPLKNSKFVKAKQRRVVIILDGLNECQPQYLEPLIRILDDWDNLTPSWLGLVVSSVSGSYVARKLNRLVNRGSCESINMNARKNIGYVKEDLAMVARSMLIDKVEKSDLAEALDLILNKSELRFLYLKFVTRLGEICSFDIESIKNDFPKGLSKAYAVIFKDLFKSKLGNNKESYRNTLGPLVATRLPLDIKIWRVCCGQDEEFRTRVKSEMGPLITVYGIDGTLQVSFSHLTVRDWLCNTASQASLTEKEIFSARKDRMSKFSVKRTVGHALLANYCWERYIRSAAEGTKPELYVMNHIIYHLMGTKKAPNGRPARAADAANLLTNFQWNLKRISLKGLKKNSGQSYRNISFHLQDAFDIYLRVRPDDRPVRMIQTAIDKSRAALNRDPRQFAAQILARISDQSCIGDAQLTEFLEQARKYNPGENVQWWRPVTPTLRRVDVTKVEQLFLFEKFKKSVVKVEVSPDNGFVAAAACFDGRVKVMETKRGRNLFTFSKHRERKAKVLSLSFSFDRNGQLILATGGTDGFVIVWNAEDGTLLYEIDVGKNHVATLAFQPKEKSVPANEDETDVVSPSGSGGESEAEMEGKSNLLAVGGRDGLRLFYDDEQSGDVILLNGQKMDCTEVVWSQLHRNVLAVSAANGYIFIFDAKLRTTLQTLTHGQRVNSISFHPTKNWLVSAGEEAGKGGKDNSKLILWDSESGDYIRTWKKVHTSPILCVRFSQGGKHFACGAEDGTISIVQTEGWGNEWHDIRNEWLVSNTGRNKADDEVFNEADYLPPIEEFPEAKMRLTNGHKSAVMSLCYMPKSNRIISCSKDRSIVFWSYNPKDRETGESIAHDDKINLAFFSPDGSMLATAGRDKKLIVWNTATGKATRLLFNQEKITTLRWSPDGANVGFTTVAGLEGWKNAERGFDVPAPERKKVVEAATASKTTDRVPPPQPEEGEIGKYITPTPAAGGVPFTTDTARDRPLRFCNLNNITTDPSSIYAAVCEENQVHILNLMVGTKEEEPEEAEVEE